MSGATDDGTTGAGSRGGESNVVDDTATGRAIRLASRGVWHWLGLSLAFEPVVVGLAAVAVGSRNPGAVVHAPWDGAVGALGAAVSVATLAAAAFLAVRRPTIRVAHTLGFGVVTAGLFAAFRAVATADALLATPLVVADTLLAALAALALAGALVSTLAERRGTD